MYYFLSADDFNLDIYKILFLGKELTRMTSLDAVNTKKKIIHLGLYTPTVLNFFITHLIGLYSTCNPIGWLSLALTLSQQQILDSSNLKECADNNYQCDEF